MLKNSDLAANYDWILYMYHGKRTLITDYDKDGSVRNFFRDKFSIELYNILNSFDLSIKQVKNLDVKEKMVQMKKNEFFKNIDIYFREDLKSNLFELLDFQIKLKDDYVSK